MEATIRTGYVNLNGQRNLGAVAQQGEPGRPPAYLLRCEGCGHVYGSLGRDLRRRRCPKCQVWVPNGWRYG